MESHRSLGVSSKFCRWESRCFILENSPGSQAPVDETGSQKTTERFARLIPLCEKAIQGQGRGPESYCMS